MNFWDELFKIKKKNINKTKVSNKKSKKYK